jgi:hypothetical protein
MITPFRTGPDAPFIASREAIPHDGSPDGLKRRRMLTLGRTKGGSALLSEAARFGDIEATGTRPEREPAEAAAREKAS